MVGGYDVDRFVGRVDPELVCEICHDVMKEPLQLSWCEHIFCRSCIG